MDEAYVGGKRRPVERKRMTFSPSARPQKATGNNKHQMRVPQDELDRRDREVVAAIEFVRSYLSDSWISEDCHDEHPVMGCSSCQAAILHRQLTMLANSIRENLGDDPESARSELSRHAQELDMGN